MRIICDYEKCTGCLACVVSCTDRHYPAAAADAVPLRAYRKVRRSSGLLRFETDSCRHCAGAPCVEVCPTGALYHAENGLVLHQREKCVGCRKCADVCPYDIPRFDAEGAMVKCDGCGGENPACVTACQFGALGKE